MLVPSATEGLVVHQLLCGREIADPRLAPNPLFGMAAQMANFVYLVADGASGQCATVPSTPAGTAPASSASRTSWG